MELWRTPCDRVGTDLRAKANRKLEERKDENNWNPEDATELLT